MSRAKRCGVQSFDGFPVEVMRFRSPLFDKESTQVQVALIMGQTIKADESQLDFRMPTIPWQLLRTAAKDAHQMIRQTDSDIEKSFLTRC